jgi:hypothetical protein
MSKLTFHPVTGQRAPVIFGLDLAGARNLLPKHRAWRFDPRTGHERHPDDVLYDPFLEKDADVGAAAQTTGKGFQVWLAVRLVAFYLAGLATGWVL